MVKKLNQESQFQDWYLCPNHLAGFLLVSVHKRMLANGNSGRSEDLGILVQTLSRPVRVLGARPCTVDSYDGVSIEILTFLLFLFFQINSGHFFGRDRPLICSSQLRSGWPPISPSHSHFRLSSPALSFSRPCLSLDSISSPSSASSSMRSQSFLFLVSSASLLAFPDVPRQAVASALLLPASLSGVRFALSLLFLKRLTSVFRLLIPLR